MRIPGKVVIAPVLPSNTPRFYVTFDRPARGIDHQSGIKLLDSKNIAVENAFMDFGQELWGPDGKRLTVFFANHSPTLPQRREGVP